jgi:hypothetical protein
VDGELEVHHGDGTREADADPDADDLVADADPDAHHFVSDPDPDADADDLVADADPDAHHFVSDADPDPDPDDLVSDADADAYCPLRFGAVVVHHPGAELLRDRHHQRWLGNRCQQHPRGRRHLPGGEYQLLVVT